MEKTDTSSYGIFLSLQFLASNYRGKNLFWDSQISYLLNCLFNLVSCSFTSLFYPSVWYLAPDTMFRSANLLLRQAVTHESIVYIKESKESPMKCTSPYTALSMSGKDIKLLVCSGVSIPIADFFDKAALLC